MTEETENTTSEPAFEDAFAGSDELFAGMMDDYDAGQPEAPAVVEEEAQPEVQAEEASAPDAVEEGTEATAKPAERSVDAVKARKAAEYAKLPESFLETASDDDLLDWYASHAKAESDAKRAFRENAELRRELDEVKATKGAEPTVPTAPEDQELIDLLEAELGPEGKKIATKMAEREATAQQRITALEAAAEQRLVDVAWSGVSGRLGIEDKDAYARIEPHARALAKTQGPWSELKGEAQLEALLTAAARAVMPNVPSEPELKRRAAISESRKNGSPTAAPQRVAPKKPLTHEEVTDAKLDAIIRGESDISKLRAIGSK